MKVEVGNNTNGNVYILFGGKQRVFETCSHDSIDIVPGFYEATITQSGPLNNGRHRDTIDIETSSGYVVAVSYEY